MEDLGALTGLALGAFLAKDGDEVVIGLGCNPGGLTSAGGAVISKSAR